MGSSLALVQTLISSHKKLSSSEKTIFCYFERFFAKFHDFFKKGFCENPLNT